jgi:hypothetical protein
MIYRQQISIPGAHTFGKVQCQFTRQNCSAGQPQGALENLDQVTPTVFDNKYYGNLLHGQAQLPSDQVMLSDPTAPTTTAPVVHRFASNQKDFFTNFVASMIKMGNISPADREGWRDQKELPEGQYIAKAIDEDSHSVLFYRFPFFDLL